MRKFFKEWYYFFKYAGTKSYSTYVKLDVLLIYLNEIKIKSISSSYSNYTITFNDDTILVFWNGNRWYAWMSHGSLCLKNGKKLEWDQAMPSYEVLYHYMVYIKSIEPKEEKKEKPNNDYSEFLPLKTLRKLKLKKLK